MNMFRAYHKNLHVIDEVHAIDWDLENVDLTNRVVAMEDVILMQCTGVYDSQGKMICEGDILESTIGGEGMMRNVIVYDAPSFKHRWLDKRTASIRNREKEPMFHNTFIVFKVIGNMYEQPDLLKEV